MARANRKDRQKKNGKNERGVKTEGSKEKTETICTNKEEQ